MVEYTQAKIRDAMKHQLVMLTHKAKTAVDMAIAADGTKTGPWWHGKACGLIEAIKLNKHPDAQDIAEDLGHKLDLATAQPGQYSAH